MENLETDLIWMSLVIFIPTTFALVLLFFPKGWEETMRWWSLFGTAATLGVSLCMFIHFRYDTLEFHGATQDKETRAKATLLYRADQADLSVTGEPTKKNDWVGRFSWIQRFNIDYYLGTDGISMVLVLMTTVLCFLAMIASWKIDKFVRGYCILFLVLETGMIGTFLALDFFLFYIFWEVMLLPMYFLIGVWGGPRREYAAIKFFLYTLLGSVFILVALLGFYFTDLRDFVSPEKVAQAADRLQKDNPGMEAEDAFKKASVNSFDLMALTRAGKAAMQYLNSPTKSSKDIERISRTYVKEHEAKLATWQEALKTANKDKEKAEDDKGKADAEGRIEKAKEMIARHTKALENGRNWDKWLAAGFEDRLKQGFFTWQFQYTMFLFLFIGFAIKVPVFPFHTWLPDAHVEAPTAISMILAGVLLKLGGYGIIRLCYPICPYAAQFGTLGYYIAIFGVINIVYGAFAAMAQTDFKRLVAYSSISHMGYVILGIAVWSNRPDTSQYWSWGMNGAMFQMVAHGITSAGMFFCVGVIYDRAHHRNLDNFRGLYEPMPMYGGISAVIFFAAMGLPGLCGFVGEFMVVLATWEYSRWMAVLAALTVVLTAAYILWTIQRVFMGENPTYKRFTDVDLRELACVIPLVVLAVLLGVMPTLILNWMEPSVTGLIDTLSYAAHVIRSP
jgi:NADH-quinone oxidoreductase subunit M